jgi:hypothetical protein
VRRYNHPNLIQIGMLGHVIGDDKMPDVNGVEGSEIEADFHVVSQSFTKNFHKVSQSFLSLSVLLV